MSVFITLNFKAQLRRSWLATGLAALAVLTSAIALTPQAHAEQSQQSAAEMLQDGLDALLDRQTDLAGQLFEQLMLTFPGSPESARAERELGVLGTASRAERQPEEADVFAHRNPRDEPALRLKFAADAGDRVFFAENSAVIGGRARALLEHQARWLAVRKDLSITIIGRADDGASADASRELSAKRAEAVREKLIASGIAAARMQIDARGTRDPVATCRTDLCQAQNRHAETFITLAEPRNGAFDAGEAGVPAAGRSQDLGRARATTLGGAAGGGLDRDLTVSR
ncbi:MAG: OmpA family protein [Hyphomicrobium sp.]|nr:OmpA family protein [Hyphomicrobium sp.]